MKLLCNFTSVGKILLVYFFNLLKYFHAQEQAKKTVVTLPDTSSIEYTLIP